MKKSKTYIRFESPLYWPNSGPFSSAKQPEPDRWHSITLEKAVAALKLYAAKCGIKKATLTTNPTIVYPGKVKKPAPAEAYGSFGASFAYAEGQDTIVIYCNKYNNTRANIYAIALSLKATADIKRNKVYKTTLIGRIGRQYFATF